MELKNFLRASDDVRLIASMEEREQSDKARLQVAAVFYQEETGEYVSITRCIKPVHEKKETQFEAKRDLQYLIVRLADAVTDNKVDSRTSHILYAKPYEKKVSTDGILMNNIRIQVHNELNVNWELIEPEKKKA